MPRRLVPVLSTLTSLALLATPVRGRTSAPTPLPLEPHRNEIVLFDFEDGVVSDWTFAPSRSYRPGNAGGTGAEIRNLISAAQGTGIVRGSFTLKFGSDLPALTGTSADWFSPFSGELRSPNFQIGATLSVWRSLQQMGLDSAGVWSDGYYLEVRDASTHMAVLPIERYAGNTLDDHSTSLDDLLDGTAFDPGLELTGTITQVVPHDVVGSWVYLALGFWGNDGQEAAFVLIDDIATTPADITPPSIQCSTPPDSWQDNEVAIHCFAEDADSGLANPSDASFVLIATAPAGVETDSAETGSRTVCDTAGNCTTAGPITGIRIDRRAPTINLIAPSASTYQIGQVVAASYECVDAGSGLTACDGPVSAGAPVPTASSGEHTFLVSAVDAVGNTSSEAVSYRVAYRVCTLFDQSKAHRIGSTVPIKLMLCDVNGTNLSMSSTTVIATGVMLLTTNAPGTLEDSGHANPDHQFRFSPDLADGGGYVLNLALAGFSQGTYQLLFTVNGDATTYTVQFQVK